MAGNRGPMFLVIASKTDVVADAARKVKKSVSLESIIRTCDCRSGGIPSRSTTSTFSGDKTA